MSKYFICALMAFALTGCLKDDEKPVTSSTSEKTSSQDKGVQDFFKSIEQSIDEKPKSKSSPASAAGNSK